jgi:hypothetical protein
MSEVTVKPVNKKLRPLHWILIISSALVVIAVIVAVFYEPAIPELPEEFKQNVRDIVTEGNDRFTVQNIELLRTGTIQIMLYLDQAPNANNFISLNVKSFIDKIEKAYNYDLDLQMLVAQPIPDTDKVRYYGKGTFYTYTGKIEYEAAP